ncbi:hypothetical protein [Neisseria zalophi]|uniref:hypothetical protein n=1 Tax=Neisseria zalophi TaxID=640030 RepID=UPI001CD94C1D|nr:hypothetical protein [Neisseria zalophi]
MMKYSFRITKYKIYGDDKKTLYSLPDEWTSFFDVEKGIVSMKEYKRVELEYINIILKICELLNVKCLKIKALSIYSNIKAYKNNQHIDIKKLPKLLELILREDMWCKLCSRNCQFHFGYDYYLYAVCNKDIEKKTQKLIRYIKYRKIYISLFKG